MEGVLKAAVHSIESFGSVDGPGIRFVVFLKGCKLRCLYCHNPDTWTLQGKDMRTADELLEQALRYKAYWGKKGGITVSGGEALLQIDFMIEFFRKAKALGIHTAVDTSAGPFSKKEPFFSKFKALMSYTDLVLLDIKHIDSEQHKKLTGQGNENILDCARYLSQTGKPVWVRHVLATSITDDDNYLRQLGDFLKTLKNIEKIEVLPYHSLGAYKWEQLGIPYALKNEEPPSPERIRNAELLLGAKHKV